MKKTLYILAGMLFLCSACDKEKREIRNDKSTPVVTIASPTDLKTYNNGDTIWIAGKVTDNAMHEVTIELTEDSTDIVLFSEAPHAHDLSELNYQYFWKAAVSKITKATLTVKAEDHASHEGSASVRITIDP